jgi:hypothetical protein
MIRHEQKFKNLVLDRISFAGCLLLLLLVLHCTRSLRFMSRSVIGFVSRRGFPSCQLFRSASLFGQLVYHQLEVKSLLSIRYYSLSSSENNLVKTETTKMNQDIVAITYSTLIRQNATTTNAIIEHFAENESFQKLAKYEGEMTLKRDQEDDEKLAKGIRFAQQKGVLDPQHIPEPYNKIDVFGKTPEEVSNYILDQVQNRQGNLETGFVIVLCGLSGTGKVGFLFLLVYT